jgi:tripartite-type tricarboxylate transporter receptor subunit TctC
MTLSTRYPRLLLLAAAAMACVAPAGSATAQGFPSKPIRLVVPFAPGGALDNMARALGKSLGETTGQTVLVENRPGANSAIGTVAVARSAPDGYTLLVQGSAFLIVPSMMQSAGYDALREFVPVNNLARVPQILVVHPSSPARNINELVASSKAAPGQLNFGSGGSGSSGHMATELLMQLTGARLTHVPYKGNAPALVDLLGGQLQLMFDNFPTALPHVKTGKLRALGVTSARRSPSLPEVPAIGEFVPGYEASIFQAVFAPAGTPRDIVARLHAEIARFADDPANKTRYHALGVDLEGSPSPEKFSAQIAAEHERWTAIVRQAGIKAD